jgi:predicted unusual protein kinase regulating ubiquinone biosynthesis (AarF/ABC1/UbiB family)
MEWIEGTKLTVFDAEDESQKDENLRILESGVECTMSQLLDTGVMHADPHAGNLLKVRTDHGAVLGYLDFGMISTLPEQVRDGLVCAVVQLVFSRDVEAVCGLFAELQLLPEESLQDASTRAALIAAMEDVLEGAFVYPETDDGTTAVPRLNFSNLMGSFSTLVADFEFRLPPYFLNNARGLATLEGITKTLDPSYNSMRIIYPFALTRLLNNPSMSPVVDKTLMGLTRSPVTGRVSYDRLLHLLDDSAMFTGYSKRKVLTDILKSKGGRRFVRRVAWELTQNQFHPIRRSRGRLVQTEESRQRFLRL